ncbi:hypothetical protein Taro_040245 [Colocasia esculenta]|uniref:NPH3 domain-containing protein n=1 Tax=Colocasia esculenta TaxID=4460 RepID=A0A843WBD0_COLES|nr:hypothetical protein [Colocasia esculenta]
MARRPFRAPLHPTCMGKGGGTTPPLLPQAHPTLTEYERKRLCRVMEYQKLSIDACMHAAQNERLPLRVVVQVLFSEQVKISNAIASSSLKDAAASGVEPAHQLFHPLVPSPRKQLLEGTPQSFQEGWAAAKKDINTLKFELESMKAKYLELQNDMDVLQRQLEKMSLKPTSAKHSSACSSGWKKLSKLTKIGVDGQEIGAHGPPLEAGHAGNIIGEQHGCFRISGICSTMASHRTPGSLAEKVRRLLLGTLLLVTMLSGH